VTFTLDIGVPAAKASLGMNKAKDKYNRGRVRVNDLSRVGSAWDDKRLGIF
jgi:hypothetical protein